jgi:hypothetical protein
MNLPRFRLSLPGLALLLLLPATYAAAKEEVILEFKNVRRDPDGTVYKCYEYTFGDWENKVNHLRGRGTLIQAPGGKGGMGENKTMIRFDQTPLVDLIVVIGNANNAQVLNFGLTDRDGTEQTWQISLAGLPKGVEQRIRLDMTKPSSEQKPGTKPGMDLKKLSVWQLRGDYTDPNVEVLLVKLVGQK